MTATGLEPATAVRTPVAVTYTYIVLNSSLNNQIAVADRNITESKLVQNCFSDIEMG